MYKSLLQPVVPEVPRQGDPFPVGQMYQQAKALRQPIEARYDEAASMALPGRKGFSLDQDSSQVYDDTAVTHTPEFASTIQSAIMPNFGIWAQHIAGALVEDPEERAEITAQLQIVDRYIYDMINSSSAASEVHEGLIDLALGTGCLRIDQGMGLHPFTPRSVPIRNLSFTVGPDGQPDGIFEDRHLFPSQWDVDYAGIVLPKDLDAAKSVQNGPTTPPPGAAGPMPQLMHGVEAWYRDWTEPKANRWVQCVFFPAHGNHEGLRSSASGAGCQPYVGPFRWSKASGEAWGRGPLFNLLPSMRTVNFAMKALLDHSDLALAGLWSVEDDGVVNVNTIRLEPGALIPRAPGSQGIQNIRPGQDFNFQQFMLEEFRKQIKRALYVDELGDPERSPKTATEIQQRMANLSRRIGSPFARLINELVFPFVARVRWLLKKQGLIKMPAIDGRRYGIMPASPLGQSRNFDEVDSFDRFIASATQAFGQEAVVAKVDVDQGIDYLAERFNIPHKIVRTKEGAGEVVAEAAGAMGVDGTGQPEPGGIDPAALGGLA